jgi:hypothetical protein
MMRKDVSGGGEAQVQKIRKKSKFKKSEKMMRKDVSGGQRSKFKKSEIMMRKHISRG